MVDTEWKDDYHHGGLAVCELCGGRREKHRKWKLGDGTVMFEVRCRACRKALVIPERLPVGPGSRSTAAYEWPKTVADLKPAEYNPRTLAPEAAAGLAFSMDAFGDVASGSTG